MRLKTSLLIPASLLVLMLIQACMRPSKDGAIPSTGVNAGSPAGIVVADTIIYEVLISNTNPDDYWAAKCLGRLNREMLIDSIFAMVYEKRATAFNHETNEKLTPKQVREIEAAEGFTRDNIGMIQFTEAWYLNPGENTMTKKVLSLVLGYNFFSSDGELFGHKPVFRLEMK